MCNKKVESSRKNKKAKREGKYWKKCNNRCGLTGKRRVFFFWKNRENKSLKRKKKM